MPKIKFSIVAIVLAAVALAACGGSDAPSKSDYIAKADASCKKNDAETKQLGEQLNAQLSKGDFAAAAATAQKGLESSKANFDEVKNMDRPDGTSDQLDAVFTSAQKGFDQLSATITAIKSGNVQSIQAEAAKVTALTTATSKLATEFGFKSCGVSTS